METLGFIGMFHRRQCSIQASSDPSEWAVKSMFTMLFRNLRKTEQSTVVRVVVAKGERR
jgi:hypothetical protein